MYASKEGIINRFRARGPGSKMFEPLPIILTPVWYHVMAKFGQFPAFWVILGMASRWSVYALYFATIISSFMAPHTQSLGHELFWIVGTQSSTRGDENYFLISFKFRPKQSSVKPQVWKLSLVIYSLDFFVLLHLTSPPKYLQYFFIKLHTIFFVMLLATFIPFLLAIGVVASPLDSIEKRGTVYSDVTVFAYGNGISGLPIGTNSNGKSISLYVLFLKPPVQTWKLTYLGIAMVSSNTSSQLSKVTCTFFSLH